MGVVEWGLLDAGLIFSLSSGFGIWSRWDLRNFRGSFHYAVEVTSQSIRLLWCNEMIYIGTSGYSFPDWKGNFYPEKIQQRDMLSFYSDRFSTVEVNFTYYRYR